MGTTVNGVVFAWFSQNINTTVIFFYMLSPCIFLTKSILIKL
jgi:hypothetical protein